MNKLIKIHGTSGAGKTTAARAFMEAGETKRYISQTYWAYETLLKSLPDPVYTLGSYKNTCGGMDTISSVDDQIDHIRQFYPFGHILYEGLLMSTYYGKLGDYASKFGRDHIWAFLDTPMELCLERVKSRRLAKGDARPFNPNNTILRQKSIDNLRKRLEKMGANVVILHHDQPMAPQLVELFRHGS